MGEVSNTIIQIGYQAYLADCLFLDIPMIKQLPLFLGRPFHRACGAMINMGCGTMTIDDGVIKHTYYPKPRAKAYLENFKIDEDEDWLSCFEVGRDKGGSPKYGRVAPSFLDNEDEMARALAMEVYFNSLKNIIVFKKLIDFLGLLSVQLKNTDWDLKEALHESMRKLEVKQKSEKSPGTNPIQIDPQVKPDDRLVAPPERLESAVYKNQSRPNGENNAYNKRLSTLQTRQFGIPRLVDWNVFEEYGCEDALLNMIKIEYMDEDRDVFLDRSWENVFSNGEKVYREWFLEFYSTIIGQPTTIKKKLVDIRYPLLHIMHKILVGAFTHRSSSRDKVQKFDLWLLSLLDEGNNANVAWILAEYHSKKSSEYKRESEIYGGLMLMRNGYMLEHSMSILHHLADEANYAYLTYELLNISPYPYPYVPYPHPYTHYLDMGNPSYEGCQYGAPGDAYLFTGARPSYGGNSIILRSGYEIKGSSRGVQDDDDKSDQFIRSEDCVESYDDMDD
uniref:Uncharacterized protein n=1 Tax=Tanacetum cinerariifolium TaxID=118510 RepID=A0A699HX36_TANCI|nr:hypothetical protein [Tanacetum cinerariifolium]